MKIRMSLKARQELLEQVRKRYHFVNKTDKGKILDGFIATTCFTQNKVESKRRIKSRANAS